MLFGDDAKEGKKARAPVAPAKRSAQALKKVATKKLEDVTEVHSFQTLLKAVNYSIHSPQSECRQQRAGRC